MMLLLKSKCLTPFPSGAGGRITSYKGKLYLYLYRTEFKDPFRLTVVGIRKKCCKMLTIYAM